MKADDNIIFPSSFTIYDGDLSITIMTSLLQTERQCVNESGWTAIPHFHLNYEAHYILNGSVNLIISDNRVFLNNGEFIVIPPNCVHYTEYRSDENTELRHFSFMFSLKNNNEEVPEHSVYEYFDGIFKNIKVNTGFIDSELLLIYIERILQKSNQNEWFPGITIQNLMMSLLLESAEIIRSHQSRYTSPNSCDFSKAVSTADAVSPETIERIIKIDYFISLKYMNKPSYDELAKFLFISRGQCIQIVKKLTGTTLSALILKQRMETAGMLIRTTDMYMSDIAAHIGYKAYSGFFYAYKKYFGVSPEQDRTVINETKSSKNYN